MNNMDLGYEMFCYQCEQTANGKGCTKLGVCGKTPEIANLQDLLIFQITGISCYGKVLQNEGQHIDKNIIRFIENVLFTTLTNVNFDSKVHVELLNESQRIKENLRTITGELHNQTSYATYDLPETKTQMLKDAQFAGIMYDKSLDPDIRSLRQTILYGLKGATIKCSVYQRTTYISFLFNIKSILLHKTYIFTNGFRVNICIKFFFYFVRNFRIIKIMFFI